MRDGVVEAIEFTAIYPAGTDPKRTTTYKGEKLPDFGVTGVWPLIRRTNGRGLLGMVDYLSPNPGYGFITMLPYQYAGGITYNAFHNAGVRCQLNWTPFLPARLAQGRERARRQEALPEPLDHQPRPDVARLHAARLRPHERAAHRSCRPSSTCSSSVPTFRNLPQCYDVFDIDGDGTPRGDGRAVLPRLQEQRAHAGRRLRHQQARAVLPLALRRQRRARRRSARRS